MSFDYKQPRLGRTTSIDHHIDTGSHAALRQRPYQVAQADRRFIEDKVIDMLSLGVIQMSHSPWAPRWCSWKRKMVAFTSVLIIGALPRSRAKMSIRSPESITRSTVCKELSSFFAGSSVVAKFPLGMLTKEQILAGYEALDKIENCIKRKSDKSELVEACSKFYTCIPHSFSQRSFKRFLKNQLFSVGNHTMLWRGSRNTNFAGVLNSGLCITPQAASVNGCMFEKGVYFGDCVSKSASCCFRKPQEQGLKLLCEVSLGNIMEEANAKSYDTLPKGIKSIMGVDKFTPNRVGDMTMSNGVMMACGKLVKQDHSDLSLLYNEYIVYNINQVKLVYLVKVEFVENDARE
ncbi:uncharacterized protein LOC142765876 [Rhipicephalus microplus]|uniref:uncharacterized protein LOC142765876 n=1 Tax=Rhipicephalus microplus TaxID=6941 RepID=UPI003F6DA328